MAKAKGKREAGISRGEPLSQGAVRPSQCVIAKGSDLFALAEQVRITPAPKSCGIAGTSIRFLSNANGRSIITDVENASNSIEQRAVHEPTIQRLYFHSFPVCLGYTQERRVGNPSLLSFLHSAAELKGRLILPDAATDIVPDRGAAWYVGCRDGTLYKFSCSGEEIWRRNIGGSTCSGITPVVAPFMSWERSPCLRIAASLWHVVVAEGNRFELFTANREHRCHTRLTARRSDEGRIQAAVARPMRAQLAQRLGFETLADSLQTGYLRWR